jgi:hypothetical protein
VSISRLLPLAMLSLLAMVLPSVAGWGPREGVTAWAFSAAGLTAAQGAATAVVYGILVLAASLPGSLVLVAERLPRRGVSSRPVCRSDGRRMRDCPTAGGAQQPASQTRSRVTGDLSHRVTG